MARSEKNVTVTRRVSEAEQRENPYIDTGPRLRVGLRCVDTNVTFFSDRAIRRSCSFKYGSRISAEIARFVGRHVLSNISKKVRLLKRVLL